MGREDDYRDRAEKRSVRDKDDRDRLSWSEIDKLRSGKKVRNERPSASRKEKHVTQQYKNDLNDIFDKGVIPDYLKEDMAALSKPKDEGQLRLLAAIRDASSPAALRKAVNAYTKKHKEFPDDTTILYRVLECDDEAVLLQAIRQIAKIAEVEPLPSKRQLALKLESIALMAEDGELIDEAEELRRKAK